MQEMRDLPVEIDLSGVSALAFTSRNGVAAFARKSSVRLPAFCVGTATAATARALGFECKTATGTAAALTEILPSKGVLHVHGVHVTRKLGQRGIALYDQVALPLDANTRALLKAGEVDAVALFSPRSAVLFTEACTTMEAKIPPAYALSSAVAAPLAGHGVPKICPTPSAQAMLRLLSADYPA